MGLQEKAEELFPKVFLVVTGEAAHVVKRADGFSSPTTWRWYQGTQAVAGATVASMIPGVAKLPAMAGSLVFTYRKMAHTAWGIGHHLNASIDPMDDVLVITGRWTGAIKKDALSAVSFGVPLAATALTAAGSIDKEAAIVHLLKENYPGFARMWGEKIADEAAKQSMTRLAVPVGFAALSGGPGRLRGQIRPCFRALPGRQPPGRRPGPHP
ncbi:hypothetical protein ACFQ7F_45835, partial [Streptomyces sp. NPDC056486]|uniref:hypothetical protein n=1 Tax=Streptomyces sp. NPDC056486 TaxID=3345835 RepID=UPI00367C7A77